jgi:hypothetical protein|tara:strand:+ start:199 stop:489 length:291 start_codon:yes stop_codon:yes gene_type:complete
MPDNNDDLRNRLAILESQLGLTTRNNTDVNNRNDNTTLQDNLFGNTNSINWKALYKLLESEVEELAFDPNAPQFVKSWASKLIEKLRTKVSPRDLL